MPQPTNPSALVPVYVPGFSDLVSLGRSTYETDAERRTRQRAVAASIQASSIPEWRQNMVGVMTKLDNLEDFATTLGLLGRAALRFAPRLTPVVRGILGIDAILNAGLLLMRVGYPGSIKKAKMLATAKGNPAAMVTRAMDDATPLTRVPGFGVALEVLQTTEYLFGQGVILGPIYGAIEETIARGSQAGLAAAEAGFLTPGQREAWAEVERITSGYPPLDPDLLARAQLPVPLTSFYDMIQAIPGYTSAVRALEAFTGLTRPDSPLPAGDQLTILGRGIAASQLLGDAAVTGVKVNLQPYTLPLGTVQIPPMRQTHPVTLAVAVEYGADPNAPRTWLLPGSPELATPEEAAAEYAGNVTAWYAKTQAATSSPDSASWLGATIAQATQETGRMLASSDLALEYPPEPSIKTLGLLLERDLVGDPDPTPAQITTATAVLLDGGADPYNLAVTTPELASAFAQVGVTLRALYS
jgi:hypothetical protein